MISVEKTFIDVPYKRPSIHDRQRPVIHNQTFDVIIEINGKMRQFRIKDCVDGQFFAELEKLTGIPCLNLVLTQGIQWSRKLVKSIRLP